MDHMFPPYKLCPVTALIPYARNARTHSEVQVAQIAASIREFGFTTLFWWTLRAALSPATGVCSPHASWA